MQTEDKREKLPTVIADSTQKKFTVLAILVSFTVFLSILVLTKVLVPAIYLRVSGEAECPAHMNDFILFCHRLNLSKSTEWHSYALNLNRTNSILILGGRFVISDQLKRDTSNSLPINLLVDYTASLAMFSRKMKWDMEYELQKNPLNLNQNVSIDSTMSVWCNQNDWNCKNNLLFLYPKIEDRNVRFSVNFALDSAVKPMFQSFDFFMYTSNPDYTMYQLFLRYSLVLVSFVSLVTYAIFYVNLLERNRTFEHKYILFLAVTLVLFNDPFYVISLFYGSVPVYLFQNIQMSLFLAYIVHFWMVMLQRIHRERNQSETAFMNCSTLVFSFVTFIITCFALSIQNVYCYYNPGLHFQNQSAN